MPLMLSVISVAAAFYSTSHFYESAYETRAWLAGFTSLGLALVALRGGVRRIRSRGRQSGHASFAAIVSWSAATTLGILVVLFWCMTSIGMWLAGAE